MPKKDLIVTTIEAEFEPELSLEELCETCHITPDFICELIEYGTLEPQSVALKTWRFNARHLQRIQRVLRLQHDLEINLAGAALAVDLMDQIDRLKEKIELLEKSLKIGERS
ncbi:MAG: cbpM [Gammaproteobacteria bacterium]|jgi:chaperone modulatory protein CbpM|nr:cbpM [Gammaproteobacteria bacterium]